MHGIHGERLTELADILRTVLGSCESESESSVSLEELMSIAEGPLGSPELTDIAKQQRPDLVEALSMINGFFAFESALHVRGSGETTTSHSVEAWNEPGLWRDQYDGMADDLFFFAEDVFGNQFALTSQHVVTFEPETGEIEIMCATMSEWAVAILADYQFLTGYPLANDWQKRNGPLFPGYRLVPKQPFVLGGEYAVDNLYALEAASSMRNRANIAVQIRDLPDGTTISFDTSEH